MFLDIEHQHPTTSSNVENTKSSSFGTNDDDEEPQVIASTSESASNGVDPKTASDTDLVLNWTDDLEITFRFIRHKRVNPDIAFPLYPLPENIKKIPSQESLTLRSRRKKKKRKGGRPHHNPAVVTHQGPVGSPLRSPLKSPLRSLLKSPLRSPLKSPLKSPVKLPVLHKCQSCPKRFNTLEHLQRHILTHSKTKPFKCPHCVLAFHQEDNLHRHMLSSHSISPNKSTTAITATTTTTTTPIKPFEKSPSSNPGEFTPILSEDAPLKLSLKKIFRSPFIIDSEKLPPLLPKPITINNSVKASSPLSPIKTNNTAAIPNIGNLSNVSNFASVAKYRCQICSKLFLTIPNLKQHMMIHKAHRSFKCGLCSERFSQEDHYKIHLANVHNQIGYPCSHCNISFRTSYDVTLHIASMHN